MNASILWFGFSAQRISVLILQGEEINYCMVTLGDWKDTKAKKCPKHKCSDMKVIPCATVSA
ncbi:hypothetical protein pdam_00024194, partial [Pocillopora damicornis]